MPIHKCTRCIAPAVSSEWELVFQVHCSNICLFILGAKLQIRHVHAHTHTHTHHGHSSTHTTLKEMLRMQALGSDDLEYYNNISLVWMQSYTFPL